MEKYIQMRWASESWWAYPTRRMTEGIGNAWETSTSKSWGRCRLRWWCARWHGCFIILSSKNVLMLSDKMLLHTDNNCKHPNIKRVSNENQACNFLMLLSWSFCNTSNSSKNLNHVRRLLMAENYRAIRAIKKCLSPHVIIWNRRARLLFFFLLFFWGISASSFHEIINLPISTRFIWANSMNMSLGKRNWLLPCCLTVIRRINKMAAGCQMCTISMPGWLLPHSEVTFASSAVWIWTGG